MLPAVCHILTLGQGQAACRAQSPLSLTCIICYIHKCSLRIGTLLPAVFFVYSHSGSVQNCLLCTLLLLVYYYYYYFSGIHKSTSLYTITQGQRKVACRVTV